MISLGDYLPSPAILSERIRLYLATDLVEGGQSLDEDEFLSVRKIPLSELVDAALCGQLPDGKTQAAVLRVHLMLERNMLETLKF
jgi:ADP-ribose pyrophosphatase